MSSGVEGGGTIAPAIGLPIAVAYGAGWLAWQSGKLLVGAGKLVVETNRALNRQIEEQRRQKLQVEQHRKMVAVSAYNHLLEMCRQIIEQLNSEENYGLGISELEQLKKELETICNEKITDDTARLESLTSLGYHKLDGIIKRQKQISEMNLNDSLGGQYHGLSVADLMDDMRIAVDSMVINSTKSTDVVAPNPDSLERIRLLEEFANTTSEIMKSIEEIQMLTDTYSLTANATTWFGICFDGIDSRIASLCKPTITNDELRTGVKCLKDDLARYQMMVPSIEKDLKRISVLYPVYVDASKALGEKVLNVSEFSNSSELEIRLKELEKRAEKAKECAEIYQKLGPEAYMCYAWDQELKAVGYDVLTRKEISDMANGKPSYAAVGEMKMPFYLWDDEELTQLYSISNQCSLQLIVHKDGSISLKTLAENENEAVIETQRKHCSQLKMLYQKLKENWFISYDMEVTKPSEEVLTVTDWQKSDDNLWNETREGSAYNRRIDSHKNENDRHIK